MILLPLYTIVSCFKWRKQAGGPNENCSRCRTSEVQSFMHLPSVSSLFLISPSAFSWFGESYSIVAKWYRLFLSRVS